MSRTSLPFTLDIARWQLVQGEALRAGLGPGLSTWWSGAGYPSLEGTGGQGLPGRARRGRLLQRALANRGALGAPRLGQVSPRPTSTVRTALWCTLSRWGPDWSLTPGAEIPAPGLKYQLRLSFPVQKQLGVFPAAVLLLDGLCPQARARPLLRLAPTRVGAEGESAAGNIPDLQFRGEDPAARWQTMEPSSPLPEPLHILPSEPGAGSAGISRWCSLSS